MLSNEAMQVKGFLANMKGANQGRTPGIDEKRASYDQGMLMTTKAPEDTSVEVDDICGMHAEWVRAAGVRSDNRVILYLHGGGFYAGSCETHRGLAAGISQASGVQVLVPGYRLAPEHQYRAQVDDCMNAYIWLLDNGYQPGNIVVAGESAGATLALMSMICLRDQGIAMPAAALLLSTYGDVLNHDGESYTTRAELDVIGSADATGEDRAYFVPQGCADPLLSPIRQDLSGLPPMLVQAADHEIVLSDSLRLAERAKACGVDATLQVWDGMWHCFQAFWGMVPEAREALADIGGYVRARLGMDDAGRITQSV